MSDAMREALEAAEADITASARAVGSRYNRKTKRYYFDDEMFAATSPGSFVVVKQIRAALAAQQPNAELEGIVRWSDADGSGYEYAIQQGPHGDEFVQLYNRPCLRRKAALAPQPALEATLPRVVKATVVEGLDFRSDVDLSAATKSVASLYARGEPKSPAPEPTNAGELWALQCEPGPSNKRAPSPALSPATVEALKQTLGVVVNCIAFLNRDVGTDRMEATVKSLMPALISADKAIRALASPAPSGEPDDILNRLVDWTYLHALEGEAWPSSKTKDFLISMARIGRPSQDQADAMKHAAPSGEPVSSNERVEK